MLEVRALLDGRALMDGLRCDEEEGMGLTLVWYLLGVGATEVEAGPMAGMP